MKCKKVIEIVRKFKLRTLSSVQLSDGLYIAQKISDEVRSYWRKDRNSQSQELTADSQPSEGAETFHFAKVKLVYKSGKGKIEREQDVSVPDEFLLASVEDYFIFTVRKGFANFKDEPLTADEVAGLLAETV